MSGDSCQAALHGCLPAENAAIHSAALQHSGTNPLREAVFLRRRNLFVSAKKRRAGSIRLKEQTHGSRKTRHKAPGTA
jgi:hypothetical protein